MEFNGKFLNSPEQKLLGRIYFLSRVVLVVAPVFIIHNPVRSDSTMRQVIFESLPDLPIHMIPHEVHWETKFK